MRITNKKNNKRHLAFIVTNSIFFMVAFLIVVSIFQNYQVNKQVVELEFSRSQQKTRSLVSEIFYLRTTSLELLQRSLSNDLAVINALALNDKSGLKQYLSSKTLTSLPTISDFRLIIKNGRYFWGDVSLKELGFDRESLSSLIQACSGIVDWHIHRVDTLNESFYLLMRKVPIKGTNTDKKIGDSITGYKLDVQSSLFNAILDKGGVDDIAVFMEDQIVGSTIASPEMNDKNWLEQAFDKPNTLNYLIARTHISLGPDEKSLEIYTFQDNSGVIKLIRSHYVLSAFGVVFVFFSAIYMRLWFGRRVSRELETLMEYSDTTIQQQRVIKFKGSSIKEFDQIGRSFELSFRRLDETEKQFSDLFNFSLSPIAIWNIEEKVPSLNPSAERIFPDAASKHQLVESLAPHINLCFKGATLTGINISVHSKVYRWNLSPILSDDKIIKIMAQGQDITSFVMAEKESDDARKEAEASAKNQADFLARMSHELRTPLNGIMGVAQLLKGRMVEKQDIEKMEVLCSSGEHLLAVLNDILDFSKIEQSSFNIEGAKFHLSDLGYSIEKVFGPICFEKGLMFELRSNIEDDIWVFSDQVRLNQVIYNLVSNAVKFTHEGEVVLSLSYSQGSEFSQLHIEVSDTGIGIRNERLEAIFDPFVQAGPDTTQIYGGSGLGLAIVQSLVTTMGGKVGVESVYGSGTRFFVTVPIQLTSSDHKEQSDEKLSIDPRDLFEKTVHVLLVEDSNTNAFIAKAFCEKYGMKVSWVTDGRAAIEFLENDSTVKLVLMDNQLPLVEGIEATEIIRRDLGMAVPIYACTADGSEDTQLSFLKAGANYVILKPIQERALHKAFIHFKEHFLSD